MMKYTYAFLLLAPKISIAIVDPIFSGRNYILSNNHNGGDYYFGCGDDNLCSMINLSEAQERDAVTMTCIDGSTPYTCTIGYNYNQQVLDARDELVDGGHSVGVFSNTGKNGQWYLYGWTDGTYNLENALEDETLDIYAANNDAPFVNTMSAESLSGQHWYFRTALQQITITQMTTSTSTVNIKATSTTTTTITTCLAARSIQARQVDLGSSILSTTTDTVWSTVITTTTINGGTNIDTQTSTVNSCPPTKTLVSVTTQSGTTATVQVSVSIQTTTQQGTTQTTTSSQGQASTGSSQGGSAGICVEPPRMLLALLGICILCLLRSF